MIYTLLAVIAYLAFMAGRIVEKQAQIGKNQRHLETLSKATGGRIGNV